MSRQTIVTRESIAERRHPNEILDAMKIRMAEPLPSNTTEGLRELIRREKAIVDPVNNTTVFDIMLKHNIHVVDQENELGEDELEAIDSNLSALFDMLSIERPDHAEQAYKVAVLPGSLFDDDPPMKLDVFVNALGICDKRKVHILRAKAHLVKCCEVEMAFAVLKKSGTNKIFEVMYWGDFWWDPNSCGQ